MTDRRRGVAIFLAVGAAGFLLVPWYSLQDSVFALAWIPNFATKEAAPALLQTLVHGRGFLAPIGLLHVAGHGRCRADE
jgi:iron(III) transport system permease protein